MSPPSQCAIGGGGPASGYGTTRMPHDPWFQTRLSMTVSFRPPARTMPVPTAPNAAVPALGTVPAPHLGTTTGLFHVPRVPPTGAWLDTTKRAVQAACLASVTV